MSHDVAPPLTNWCPGCDAPLPPGWQGACPSCGQARGPSGMPDTAGVPTTRSAGRAGARGRSRRLDPDKIFSWRRLSVLLVIIGIYVGILALTGWNGPQDRQQAQSLRILPAHGRCAAGGDAQTRTIQVGDFAPDVLVDDLDGQRTSLLKSHPGEPVWLVFWDTQCLTCQRQLWLLQQTAHSAGSAVNLVSVDSGEDPVAVPQWLHDHGYDFHSIFDPDGQIADAYCITNVPTHLFIDSQGRIRSILLGLMGSGQLKTELDALARGS